MTTPLTLLVEGKPLVFDVPVPVGVVIPAGVPFLFTPRTTGRTELFYPTGLPFDTTPLEGEMADYFTARPPVAPESFADGDVAWVRVERRENWWCGPDDDIEPTDEEVMSWLQFGAAYLAPTPRPESLADVLDDLGLTDEQRARVEKAANS